MLLNRTVPDCMCSKRSGRGGVYPVISVRNYYTRIGGLKSIRSGIILRWVIVAITAVNAAREWKTQWYAQLCTTVGTMRAGPAPRLAWSKPGAYVVSTECCTFCPHQKHGLRGLRFLFGFFIIVHLRSRRGEVLMGAIATRQLSLHLRCFDSNSSACVGEHAISLE